MRKRYADEGVECHSAAEAEKLSAFLGRITRNLSLNRFFEKTADKRGSGQTAAVLDELAECVSSGVTTEDISDNNTLRHALNDFLFCLEPENVLSLCKDTGI